MGSLGIITAGGPAPGMNAVIASILRTAESCGWQCIGICEGFRDLSKKHFCKEHWFDHQELQQKIRLADGLAGCILGTSRKKIYQEDYLVVGQNLDRIGIDKIITIGGDGTATGAYNCFREIGIPFVHVPKTIDNDIELPGNWFTFGFWSAVEDGANKIRSLALDATSCKNRYYFITTQGRNAGHLALEVGFAGGADIIIIPEMFENDVSFEQIAKVVAGGILSRFSKGYSSGVAVFSEGLLGKVIRNMSEADVHELEKMVGHPFERDEHGYIRQSDVDTGKIIAQKVDHIIQNHKIFNQTLHPEGNIKLQSNKAGYSMRCATPTAFDLSYCYQLGSHAVSCLEDGRNAEIVCISNKRFSTIPIASLCDHSVVQQHMVDLESSNFQTAIRQSALLVENLNNPQWKRVMSYTGLPYNELCELALRLPKKEISLPPDKPEKDIKDRLLASNV